MEDCEHTSSWTVAVQLSQFVRCKHSHWNTRVQKWHSVKFGSRAVKEPWGNVQYAVNSRICKHVLRTAVQFSSCCKQDLTSSYSTDRERWIAAATYRITLVLVGHSLYFATDRKMASPQHFFLPQPPTRTHGSLGPTSSHPKQHLD